MLHDLHVYVARARFAWSPFFFGAASAALRRGAGPGLLVPPPLASWTTKLTDVEVRFLHSTASCWTRWRSLFVALRSAS